MRVTIDIPAELRRQLEARIASSSAPSSRQWLERWLALADEAVGGPSEATAREHLEADRDRLEGRCGGG